MDYEYCHDALENYTLDSDVNYRLEDDPSSGELEGPAQGYCFSDDFYDDEIENCVYMRKSLIPSF